MNKFDLDFFNNELIRFWSNCYRYSVRDTYGFSYSTGVAPGELRAKQPGNWRYLHNFVANIIIDGLTPLWVARSLDDKIGDYIPTVPDGHYMVVATIGYRDFAFRKIDKIISPDQIECSYRMECWDGKKNTANDRAFLHTDIKTWSELTQWQGDVDRWYTAGIFACPNKGLDLSMAKVIYDIGQIENGTRYFNGLNPKFIEEELEFYDGYKDLPRSGFESDLQVKDVLDLYDATYSKYFSFNISSGAKNGSITSAINKIYQKTPLADADRERVYNSFIKNLGWSDRLYAKLNKIY